MRRGQKRAEARAPRYGDPGALGPLSPAWRSLLDRRLRPALFAPSGWARLDRLRLAGWVASFIAAPSRARAPEAA